MSEQVLVVPTEILSGYFKHELGFIATEAVPNLYDTLKAKCGFVERGPAETNLSIRQIIPYAEVRYENQVFVTERTKKQTEVRLHDKLSIGLGGHINPIDAFDNADIIEVGMMRELLEEMYLPNIEKIIFKGYIYDNTSEVGSVHLGLLYEVWVSEESVSIREVHKMNGWWCKLEDLFKFSERLETWSKIACKQIVYDEVPFS